MYLLLAFVYQCMAWHITPVMLLSTISSISRSVSNSNFFSCFFRHVCYNNPGADKNYAESSSYISMHCRRFWIVTSLVVYHFACINNDTLMSCVFWNLPRLFCVFVASICNVLHYQIAVEFFLVWQWRFIEFLPTIWMKVFPQHQKKFVNVSITKFEGIFECLG